MFRIPSVCLFGCVYGNGLWIEEYLDFKHAAWLDSTPLGLVVIIQLLLSDEEWVVSSKDISRRPHLGGILNEGPLQAANLAAFLSLRRRCSRRRRAPKCNVWRSRSSGVVICKNVVSGFEHQSRVNVDQHIDDNSTLLLYTDPAEQWCFGS